MKLQYILPTSTFLILAASHLFGGDPLPKDWSLSVESAREWLEADLKGAGQQGMNRITAALADLADAELAIVYLRLYDVLGTVGKKELRFEQAAWLKAREKAAEDAVESHGGSLAPMEANLGFTDFTKKRLVELNKRLTAALSAEKTPK